MGTVARCRSCSAAALLLNPLAIITSGGTGIGKAIATELLHLECNVIIISCKFDRLHLPSNSTIVTLIQCNIREEEGVIYSTTAFSNNEKGKIKAYFQHCAAKRFSVPEEEEAILTILKSRKPQLFGAIIEEATIRLQTPLKRLPYHYRLPFEEATVPLQVANEETDLL